MELNVKMEVTQYDIFILNYEASLLLDPHLQEHVSFTDK